MRLRNRALIPAVMLATTLSGCDITDGDENAAKTKPSAASATRRISDNIVKVGKPYQVSGRSYVPSDTPHYDEVGFASWYGEELAGSKTANGEPFKPTAIAAAHPTLPLPSYVEVTSLETGRTILVRVNDRGPFSSDRVIDLSRGAAEQLGIAGRGNVAVRVRRVSPPDGERAMLRDGGKVPARTTLAAHLLDAFRRKMRAASEKLGKVFKPAEGSSTPGLNGTKSTSVGGTGAPSGYAVQIAAFGSANRARQLASRVGATAMQSGAVWRVRFGPYPDQAAAQSGVRLARTKGFNDVRIVANDHP
ncbi:septal ring lytic transglycosylase RlpA family protein [Sphingobium sp. H39-3-25]|uniref:septal ring lytic transglycosylase RlpA family protein n=1 Tax=Sphingobium arseniciresistens TaxID=3030834 RepID=UPI0023B9F7E3|nr:septal ring lytic transglycosylase RlpA family protein [Sphingobium arseniciresistens]